VQDIRCQSVEGYEAVSVTGADAVDHRFVRSREVGESRQIYRVRFSAKLAKIVARCFGFVEGYKPATCGCPYECEIESVRRTGVVVLCRERLCGTPPIGAAAGSGAATSGQFSEVGIYTQYRF